MLKRVSGLIRYNRDWFKYVTYRYRQARGAEPVVFRLRNGQILTTNADARFILNEIYLDRVYDVPGVDLTRSRHVLDLGANAGVFALYIASRAPESTVYSFEPESRNFALLERNLKDNHVAARSYKLAVSGYCGAGRLKLMTNSFTHTLRAAGNGGEDVQCVDMAEVFKLTGVPQFDFVKMDVEGAESDILGACTDGQLLRMRAFSIEWHHSKEKLQQMISRFAGIGFEAGSYNIGGQLFLKARLP